MNYQDIKACDATRHADALFMQFTLEKKDVMNLIIPSAPIGVVDKKSTSSNVVDNKHPLIITDKLWGNKGILLIDNNCMCNMGKGNIFGNSKCAHCKNIGRLSNYVSTPFYIENGKQVGKMLVVDRITINFPLLMSVRERAEKTQPSVIELDTFTNGLIQQWLLQEVMIASKLPHYVHYRTAFVCRNEGFYVYDHVLPIKQIATRGNLIDARLINGVLVLSVLPGIMRSLLVQLIIMFKTLNECKFDSTTIPAIVFKDELCSYMYDGVHVQGSFIIALQHLENARITVSSPNSDKITVFPQTIHSDIQHSKNNVIIEENISDSKGYMFLPEVASVSSEVKTHFMYKNTLNEQLLRDNNCSLAYNFYAVLLNLITIPEIQRSIYQDKGLKRLWSALWPSGVADTINNKITEISQLDQTTDTVKSSILPENILNGIRMHCDIVNHAWKLIKSGY